MAIKTIKNKGKRKGGKKSNRRTYKQRGGNIRMLALFAIGIMVTLNMIYILPENDAQYLRKYINENKIDVQPGPFYMGIEGSVTSNTPTIFKFVDKQKSEDSVTHFTPTISNLELALKSYPGIKKPVIVTEDYLIIKIEEKYKEIFPLLSVYSKDIVNKVLAQLSMSDVVTNVNDQNGGHIYVIDEGTLNGIIDKLVNEHVNNLRGLSIIN